jgi:hypothetical protein
MSTPKSSKMMMIGASQNFLFCFIIAKNSLSRLGCFSATVEANWDLFFWLIAGIKTGGNIAANQLSFPHPASRWTRFC